MLTVLIMESYDFPEIAVVGAANIDLVSYSRAFPTPGETMVGHTFQTTYGGKAANPVVQIAHLLSSEEKSKVALIAALGQDAHGDMYVKYYEKLGLRTDGLLRASDPELTTGTASITVRDDGENAIVVVFGANLWLSPEELRKEKFRKMIENAKIVFCQNEITPEATLEALRIAKESPNKPITVFAPAPAGELPPECYALSDYVIMNSIEAESLCGIPRPEDSEESDLEKYIRNLRKLLVEMGQKSEVRARAPLNTVITGGGRKCLFLKAASAEDDSSEYGYLEAYPVPPEKIVNTVGAGDSFCGSFVFFLLNGASMEIALQRAAVVAGHSIQRKGASSSFFNKSELPQKIFETPFSQSIDYVSL